MEREAGGHSASFVKWSSSLPCPLLSIVALFSSSTSSNQSRNPGGKIELSSVPQCKNASQTVRPQIHSLMPREERRQRRWGSEECRGSAEGGNGQRVCHCRWARGHVKVRHCWRPLTAGLVCDADRRRERAWPCAPMAFSSKAWLSGWLLSTACSVFLSCTAVMILFAKLAARCREDRSIANDLPCSNRHTSRSQFATPATVPDDFITSVAVPRRATKVIRPFQLSITVSTFDLFYVTSIE